MVKAPTSIPRLLDLADELSREVEFAPPTKYVVSVRRELLTRVEAALRGAATGAARAMNRGIELTAQHVLTDLFGSGDFPAEVLDPALAAEITIQRLLDAGFAIGPAPWPGMPTL